MLALPSWLQPTFLDKGDQVRIIEVIGYRDVDVVPPTIARFVTTEEEDCGLQWIEGIQNAIRPTLVLNPELAHTGMS
jgi:hypothetical protein